MGSTWGVYNVLAKTAGGDPQGATAPEQGHARWLVRWRVDGRLRKRTFTDPSDAHAFRAVLLQAKRESRAADARGWPISDEDCTGEGAGSGINFEDYCTTLWYPLHRATFGAKTRVTHRTNMRFAIDVLRYTASDRRIQDSAAPAVGDSILMHHLVADDVLRAVACRSTRNARTAAKNSRRSATARRREFGIEGDAEETASASTVRSFYLTLAMIIKAAQSSRVITRSPLPGTLRAAPRPRPTRLSSRFVPSIDEVFDLADAIASLGPLMSDGRHAGERFRSLVLCGGTLGPRPGEMTAHRPDWIDWGHPTVVMWHRTEARIYDPEENIVGWHIGPLKQRGPDEWREVPAIPEVADALRLHIEQGYASEQRTWTGVNGTGPLDWKSILAAYWVPAVERVFGASTKTHLRTMTPQMLRKAAITYWLDSGISSAQSAEWAGHSQEVLSRYYAGRASTNYALQTAALVRGRHNRYPAAAMGAEPLINWQ
jgi:integrase